MKYLQQKSANTIVLSFFFASAQKDVEGYSEDEVVKAFQGRLGTLRVKFALEKMIEAKYLEDINPRAEDYIYGLTAAGYSKAEEIYLKEGNNLVRKILDNGLDWYFDQLGSEKVESETAVPASDRFVTVSDNMPGYSEIIATVTEADEQIRGANDLVAEEKSWVRIHLELGLTLLKKGGRALVSALKGLLLDPLQQALKEGSSAGMKAAVQAAILALRTHLGIF